VDDFVSNDGLKNPEWLADLCSRILCWVGSTEKPDSAVPLAQALARLHKGECHVVMSLNTPSGLPDGTPSGRHPLLGRCTPLTPEIINRAKRKLAHLYGDDVFTLVLPGHPITEIKRYARNKKVKLIIVGEQGLAAEREYGQKLCDEAPCTVLTLLIPSTQIEEKNSSPDLSGMEYRGGPER
jgi:nucleotide-binding universal stress UspA family protein